MNDIDWRLLLEKYMAIVISCESISFLHHACGPDPASVAYLSKDELDALHAIEKKIEELPPRTVIGALKKG